MISQLMKSSLILFSSFLCLSIIFLSSFIKSMSNLQTSEPQTTPQLNKIKLPALQSEFFISVYYNDSIYLIECYGSLPDQQQNIHTFSFLDNSWKSNFANVPKSKASTFFPKIGTAHALFEGTLYCFGGKDHKAQFDNRLCCLDLDKNAWKIDVNLSNPNFGQIVPQARSNLCLQVYKNFLILYGGNVKSKQQNTNYIWCFNMQNCIWNRISNMVIPILQNPTMCYIDDKIYILGQKQDQKSGQLLQIKLQFNQQRDKCPLLVSKAQFMQKPQSQNIVNCLKVFPCLNKSLILFQIQPKQSYKASSTKSIWLFDRLLQSWVKYPIKISQEILEIIQITQGTYYILEECNRSKQMWKLSLSTQTINSVVDGNRYKQWKSCQICYQAYVNKNTLMQPAFKLNRQLLTSITQKINFPFSAFAMLAQNAYHHSATYVNFHYTKYKQAPIIKVEDDARLNYTNEEMEQIIVNFQIETNYNFPSIQRRVRSLLIKDFIKKQFGTNLKIAAMRLGSQMLYVSVTPNYEARVAYFTLEQDQYVCYFYAFDQKNGKIVDEFSHQTKAYVEYLHGQLIKQALHESPGFIKYAPYKNTLIILGPRTIENEQGKYISEVEPLRTHDYQDIIYTYPSRPTYDNFLNYGCKINEAMDTSLSSFLNNMFIKNEHTKISIQIYDNERSLIKRQELNDLNDKLDLRNLDTTELTRNFELKSAVLMYNSKPSKKSASFYNGVLIYHRNRLIKRFDCEFGQLISRFELMEKPIYNYFQLFGKIQVPDSLQVNQQKTDFINQMMLEKLYSKIKMIEYLVQESVESQQQQSKPRNLKQGPKLRPRCIEDHQGKHSSVKKIRKNQDDESYNGN